MHRRNYAVRTAETVDGAEILEERVPMGFALA